MASKRKRGDKWEYVIKRAGVLDKPLYFTFSSEEEGDAYCRRVEAQLDRGLVPHELETEPRVASLTQLVSTYLRKVNIKPKDVAVLSALEKDIDGVPLSGINVRWVDGFVARMKQRRLAPATIRSKVGALARCTDWGVRTGYLLLPDAPFRTLPEGYANYTEEEAALVGGKVEDIERDRRLELGEHERILTVIRAGVIARRFRDYRIENAQALEDIYTLALESAMRLSEMFTLGKDQVQVEKSTVFLTRTKNGDKRQVPLSSVATQLMARRMQEPGDQIFPWWSPETPTRKKVSGDLSRSFQIIFREAGCEDLHFHDLRHEATSRFFERTTLTAEEIMKITGHKDHRMFMRYLNLRASSLTSKLW